jgi:DNA-binding NarL/FixJ family response regulator
MLKLGVKGFVNKGIAPKELEKAIVSVCDIGTYYTKEMGVHLANSYQNFEKNDVEKLLTENELKFLKLSFSEDSYAQIAAKMCLSPRTIHGYRDSVFSKLKIHTRIGLIIFSLRIKLVTLN